jgi:uncharacterized protein with HEPN domain
MQQSDRDELYLSQMKQACRDIIRDLKGVSLTRYLHHRLLHNSTSMLLQTVGENADKLSDTFKEKHPEVPWQVIVSLRHRISHDYSGLSRSQIYSIGRDDIPQLLRSLNALDL